MYLHCASLCLTVPHCALSLHPRLNTASGTHQQATYQLNDLAVKTTFKQAHDTAHSLLSCPRSAARSCGAGPASWVCWPLASDNRCARSKPARSHSARRPSSTSRPTKLVGVTRRVLSSGPTRLPSGRWMGLCREFERASWRAGSKLVPDDPPPASIEDASGCAFWVWDPYKLSRAARTVAPPVDGARMSQRHHCV